MRSFYAVFLNVESNFSKVLMSRFRFAIGVAKLAHKFVLSYEIGSAKTSQAESGLADVNRDVEIEFCWVSDDVKGV